VSRDGDWPLGHGRYRSAHFGVSWRAAASGHCGRWSRVLCAALCDLAGPVAHRVPPVSAAAGYWPVPHREDDVSVRVLVQVGVIAWAVVEDQRRGLALPCRRALRCQIAVRSGEPPLAEHDGPRVGDACQPRVELLAQLAYQGREGVGEVAVGSAAETLALHHHRAAEPRGLGEPAADIRAFRWLSSGSVRAMPSFSSPARTAAQSIRRCRGSPSWRRDRRTGLRLGSSGVPFLRRLTLAAGPADPVACFSRAQERLAARWRGQVSCSRAGRPRAALAAHPAGGTCCRRVLSHS
jgi:hypothetical protein